MLEQLLEQYGQLTSSQQKYVSKVDLHIIINYKTNAQYTGTAVNSWVVVEGARGAVQA